MRGARRCFGDPRSHPPPPRPRGRGGGGGETRGDLLLLFLMLLLMAKKATWSFLPSARRDPPPIPTSFRTCLLHPQQEADLVVFLETEGISSLFSSPPPLAVLVLFYLISWSREEGGRKERNPTRPWGLSSQHPPPSPPPPPRRQKAPGVELELDRPQILRGEAGSSAGTERLHAGGFPFCWVFLPFSLPFLFLPPFLFFFLFLFFFFSLAPHRPPPPEPEEEMPSARRAPVGSPARGAGRGAGGGPRRNWDGFARSGAGGASRRPPPPAPPKSVR